MPLSLRSLNRWAAALIAALFPVASALAATSPSLGELEGHYEYREGATLFMVADGDRLVAILGDGKYPLRAAGVDTFMNGVGDTIPFIRDSAGRIVGFKEKGDSFKRLSPDVPDTVRSLLRPRPPGLDGKPPAYRYEPPADHADGIRVGAAGPATLSRDAAERLVAGVIDGTYPDVRSILVYQAGALRLEEYFYGYDRNRPHQMRSLTKSVIALLAGAAVDRGKLSADEPVLWRLGYAAYANPDPRKDRITLLDLLSNRSGLPCNDHDPASPGNENKLYETDDWVKAFVDLPMTADPGTEARYCSGGFFAAGRVIERAIGTPLSEFAEEVLFGPLGMRPTEWKWNFHLDRSGRNEFGQVHLQPRDMLKLGLLIQQRGEWSGRRILPASWIEAAVARQTRVEDSDYGLGIWHRWYGVKTATGERRVDTVMLSGNGGQKVYLVPSLDLVVVFTGGSFNAESPVNAMMAQILLPALLSTSETVAAADDAAIRDVVRRYVDAREARDPEAVAALFAADADQLVSSGEWRRGRDVLVKGTMASSARNTGTRTIVVETLRMVGPDVAIADARYEISGAETRKMWSTFVMARQQGQWRISAIRNMLPAPPTAASAPTPAASEQEAVLAVVDRFMQAIATKNNKMFAEVRMKGTTSIVERPADGGGTRLVRRPFDATLPAGTFAERYWDPVVHIRNGIAVVWTPYEFWEDGKTSHCGIDVFELAKENGRWRIGNMMWTVEPDACPAMRPADPSRIRPQ